MALAGCVQQPPPGFGSGRGAPAAPVEASGVAVVQSGDTVFSVARRTDTPARTLIDVNGLRYPYALRPGQRLTVPRTHLVQPGETLATIAARHGVAGDRIARANRLAPPYRLEPGAALIVPGLPPLMAAATPAERIVLRPPPLRETAPAPPAVPRERVDAAALPPPIPADPAAPEPVIRLIAPPSVVPEPNRHPPPDSPERVAVVPPPATAAPDDPTPEAPLPPRAGRSFQWPVAGRVISDFGPKSGGLTNDGINIAAAEGTAIRAAENGVVAYVGNEVRGFGNLVLIRHAGGWVTAYAHAAEILVKRGASVRRGQVIARVGSTGSVNSPQLHFEIRRGTRPVNPREYLAPQMASRPDQAIAAPVPSGRVTIALAPG